MAQNDLARSISELLDMSMNQAQKHVDNMDAEQLINAESAVDAEDLDSLNAVLAELDSEQETEPMSLSDTRKEINRLGKQNLARNETHDDVWPLIAGVSESDWQLIWPSIDESVLISLFSEASDEEQDSVSAADAQMIYDHAQDQLQEHMMYQGQIVEVIIKSGPHNTVGIKTHTGVQMVNRNQLTHLHEHVLGMTAMPSLARIQELAGVQTQATEAQNTRIQIPGVGTITQDMMPRKIKRMWADLQPKLQELDQLINTDTLDYAHVNLVCAHVKYLMDSLCHNVASAAAHKK